MKLIKEYFDPTNIEYLIEEAPGLNIPRTYRFKGIFMQSNILNRNHRIYPKVVLEKAVKAYQENYISKNRALGELCHPTGPTVNLPLVSHIVESLEQTGDDWIGVAKVMDTPNGRIVKTLMDEKIQLGTSSRCIGSLNGQYVNNDLVVCSCSDVVLDPSAPSAFVDSIIENKEFIIQNDEIVEVAITNLQNQVDKKYNSKVILEYMKEFFTKITGQP